MAIKVQGTTVVDDSRNAEVVTLSINGTPVTATPTELNILDGATVTTTELNKLGGATVTTDELNILGGATVTTAELNKLDGVTASTNELNILDGATVTTAELNILDGATVTTDELNKLSGATVTTSELNKLSGATVTTSELNKLSGATVTTAELNFLSGVTSDVQTQIDNANTKATLTKSFISGETSTIALSQAISAGAPVVSVTKEVPQTGITNNDWDVATDGANYERHDTAYSTTLTPSNATGDGIFTLGTASFASTDVGKTIEGNGGEAILKATDGSYSLVTAFNDTSTIAAGDWSMFALDVGSADAGLTLSSYRFGEFNIADASYDNSSFDFSSESTQTQSISFSVDGTKMYMLADGPFPDGYGVYQYTLSTPWVVSSASYDNIFFQTGAGDESLQDNQPYALEFRPDGLGFFVWGNNNDSLYEYTLNTAYDLSTASFTTSTVTSIFAYAIAFNDDGTKLYLLGNNSVIYQSNIDPYSLSSGLSTLTSFDASSQSIDGRGIDLNDDGTKLYMLDRYGKVYQYSLSTAFDVTTAVYDNVVYDMSSESSSTDSLVFKTDGKKMFVLGSDVVYQYSTESLGFPTNTHHTAITSAPTNTEFWTDINSMTADDSVNDGAVYYAVSTDDRTTWSIIDDTNGVRNIVRNNAGTWEVNDASDYGTETWIAASQNDEFYALEEAVDVNTAQRIVRYDLENASYDNDSFSITGQDTNPQGVSFSNDGTKMFVVGDDNNRVYQYSLSTAFNVSTASYGSVSLNVGSQDTNPSDLTFSSDGSKMYLTGLASSSVYQYSLSTPFDLSTASYDSVSFNVSSQDSSPYGLALNTNGTKMYILAESSDAVYQYSLATAFDLSTASYDNVSFAVDSQDSSPRDITLNADGTKMYIAGNDTDSVYQYTLSTAFDLSTASYDSVSFAVDSQDGFPEGVAFNTDGSKMYIVGRDTGSVYQYSTVSFDSTNRMDATQLNGVSDGNHYTLGNDLDLAITMTMPDGSTNSPTSDGVSINYDANVKNEGAVLGTDYDFDFPANDVVRITSNATQNLKVRVV